MVANLDFGFIASEQHAPDIPAIGSELADLGVTTCRSRAALPALASGPLVRYSWAQPSALPPFPAPT